MPTGFICVLDTVPTVLTVFAVELVPIDGKTAPGILKRLGFTTGLIFKPLVFAGIVDA